MYSVKTVYKLCNAMKAYAWISLNILEVFKKGTPFYRSFVFQNIKAKYVKQRTTSKTPFTKMELNCINSFSFRKHLQQSSTAFWHRPVF